MFLGMGTKDNSTLSVIVTLINLKYRANMTIHEKFSVLGYVYLLLFLIFFF